MPWSCIREALVYHEVPLYLRRIVGAVVYPSRTGLGRREMSCGVPQGSVLGPLLWNIGYDWVLRGTFLDGVAVVCYADDTLVTARGKTHHEATLRATAGVAQVVERIGGWVSRWLCTSPRPCSSTGFGGSRLRDLASR
ncbi:unnamed protein product [Arctia plantaginis]|uniref:Reverse transcriptase domain-containing protein n=1 Tax=Arctia plantaginis TaxID=874455 RepID=A0A8S1BTI6_ARCPL|nr:unnamed protein product [Arctia plantaginis]